MLDYLLAKYLLKLIREPGKRWEWKRRYPELLYTPHLHLDEYRLFKDLCKDKQVFLEYGSGGSTIYLLKNRKKVFSVESNEEFHRYMNSINLIQKSKGQSLHSLFIDLGSCNKWGKPLTPEKNTEWSRYYSEVWEHINPRHTQVDVVFIDGRFRVCCCLYSILKVVEYGWKDTLILIHDFWRRKNYHVVLKFLEEQQSATNLAAFRVKENIRTEEIESLIEEYSVVTK